MHELERARRRAASTGPAWSSAEGESFRWKGKYSYDLQSRETLETRLGVFAEFQPKLPDAFRAAEFVFLGNIDPELQLGVLDQVKRAQARGLRHDELLDPGQARRRCSSCSARVDILMVNDGEARELRATGTSTAPAAGSWRRAPGAWSSSRASTARC